MRNIRVKPQFQALGIDEHQFHLIRSSFVEHAHQQGIDKNALAGTGRSGDQQVRHLRQICRANAPNQVLAEWKRKFEGEWENSADSITSRRAIVSRRAFGTSIPTVDLPGMRSIKIDSARKARQRSSASPVMRLYLIPASGLNSKVVTTGPGLICVIWPPTPNSEHFCSMARAHSFSSLSSIFSPRSAVRSSPVEGNRKLVFPAGILGAAAFSEVARFPAREIE